MMQMQICVNKFNPQMKLSIVWIPIEIARKKNSLSNGKRNCTFSLFR